MRTVHTEQNAICQNSYLAGGESEEMFQQAGLQLDYFSEDILHYDNLKG